MSYTRPTYSSPYTRDHYIAHLFAATLAYNVGATAHALAYGERGAIYRTVTAPANECLHRLAHLVARRSDESALVLQAELRARRAALTVRDLPAVLCDCGERGQHTARVHRSSK